MSSTISPINLANVTAGAGGFVVYGQDERDYSGSSVASTGDINGDGFDDLIIGARGGDAAGNGKSGAGDSYVVFGRASGWGAAIDLTTIAAGTGGFVIHGRDSSDKSGWSVASAGDLNGDGFADLIIGAPEGDAANDAKFNAGESYVVFGKESGWGAAIDLADIAAGTGGFVINFQDNMDGTGLSVASAGDLNGDGFADLIIGASQGDAAGNGKSNAGESYVVFGKESGWGAAVELADIAAGTGGFVIYGQDFLDASGRSVGSAGDINGDGFDDLIIGAPGGDGVKNSIGTAGDSYVVFGKASDWGAAIDLADIAAGTGGFVIYGQGSFDTSGRSVASAGDINGDGFADLLIGAYTGDAAGNGKFNAGESYVVFGKPSGWGAAIELASIAAGLGGFIINGRASTNEAGYSVASAGDINGDGFDDLIIGARVGESYVIFGKSSDWGQEIDLVNIAAGTGGFVINGQEAGDGLGFSVASAGDVNGDGFDDLIVGARGGDAANNSKAGAGESYVIFGRDFTSTVTHDGTASAEVLNGTASANVMVAGLGNDTLYGQGGADALQGGAGDDQFIVSDFTFLRIDGGSGADTLSLTGSGLTLKLASISDTKLQSIEAIDLGIGGNVLRLTALEVRNLSDTSNTLRVTGGAGAFLVLDDTGWLRGSTTGDFATYTNGTATVVISASLPVITIGSDSIAGYATDDRIDGLAGNDSIFGDAGSDTLVGEDGAHTMDGGLGHDSIFGGNGIDLLSYASATGAVTVNLTNNRASGAAGNDSFLGFEYVISGVGNDSLVGDSLANVLIGGAGNDTLSGGTGDDVLSGGAGTDMVSYADLIEWEAVTVDLTAQYATEASGYDTLDGIEDVIAGAGDDSIVGDDFANRLIGIGGNDVLSGGAGDDTLDGGEGDDTLTSGWGNDLLTGGAGVDVVSYAELSERPQAVTVNLVTQRATGAAGDDTLSGIEGVIAGVANDSLLGDSLGNVLFGGVGWDTLSGGAGDDILAGNIGLGDFDEYGAGQDMVSYTELTGATQAVTVNLVTQRATGAAGNDTLDGIDDVIAGAGNDSILGSLMANWLIGGGGNDTLSGGDLEDTLAGGAGNDSLAGGADMDMVSYEELAGATQAVTVNLVTQRATGAAGNDTLSGIEMVIAGASNDSLLGDGAVNVLAGGAGNDTLSGGAGDDILSGNTGLGYGYWYGPGQDMVSYSDLAGATQAVTVNLVTQRATGAAGNDTLDGFEDAIAGAGNDSLLGDSLANQLIGGAGNDTLSGGAGNDTLSGGAGNDTLSGGAGWDAVNYAELTGATQAVTVDLTTQRAIGAAGNDTLASIEDVVAGSGNDSLRADDFDNRLVGAAGNDTLSGGRGNDSLSGGTGTDMVSYAELTGASQAVTVDLMTQRATGAAGNDTLSGIENVIAGAGNDSLLGDGFTNQLTGGAGNDTLSGGAGNDSLSGGTGEDILSYAVVLGAVTVTLTGNRANGAAGEDSLAGFEHVIGGAGADSLQGDASGNTLNGGNGADSLDGGLGNDSLVGSGENDFLSYESATGAVTISLVSSRATGAAGSDTILGIQHAIGGGGADSLLGDAINNVLAGNSGADTLDGGLGADTLDGGAGHDLLAGGDGNDFLSGGDGNDTLRGDAGDASISGGAGDDVILAGNVTLADIYALFAL